MAPSLEIPIFGPSSADKAVKLGASRLELNAVGSYNLGGTTPNLSELLELKEKITDAVPVRVMIRPRGPPPSPEPDFMNSEEEFDQMKRAIAESRRSGLLNPEGDDGFVFGVLRREEFGVLAVDVERNSELVRLAFPFKCVFHRAFDDILGSAIHRKPRESGSGNDIWRQALRDVQTCGFDGILTSGGPGKAPENIDTLSEIVKTVEEKLQIIVGGGVRSSNIGGMARALKPGGQAAWFHSSCLTSRTESEERVDEEELTSILRSLR